MNGHTEILDRFAWWSALKHGGLLIAPSKLPEFFPESIPPLPRRQAEILRRDVVRILDGDNKVLSSLLDTVLERVLELPRQEWKKGNEVGSEWSHRAITREVIKPRRVWRGPNGAVLPVFVADLSLSSGRDSNQRVTRLGVGRGRRAVSRVIEWLRRADQKIALLTNGRQWRLIHAGADYDASCEWDISLWFEEGQPSLQVTALRILLSRDALTPAQVGDQPALVQAILDSRKGQAELSSVLGERVRLAVEHLIQTSSTSINQLLERDSNVTLRDVYIAATRLIMRCVVVFFAEARDLLPRDNPIYHGSYGLEALRDHLAHYAGGRGFERLRHTYSAWPRLLSLFRLVFYGSAHEALPILQYGGKLFQPGDPEANAPVLRALAAFEDPSNMPSDAAVHQILELLSRSKVKVRQGRGSTWVEAPVDFSDLSSEYIGILYEGLLDFELRRAPDQEPMVFLNLGDQPALPFGRLDSMTPNERSELLQKLKKTTKKGPVQEEGEEEEENIEDVQDEELAEEAQEEEEEIADEPVSLEEETDDDIKRYWAEKIDAWARATVRDVGWVKRNTDLNDPEVINRAKGLVRRIVMPGQYFLVRWGGTRKGAGTFYTRPQLAGPTTRRTLLPLAYEPVKQTQDSETGIINVVEWRPKTPEEILDIKVCDPAMGSGSFLVAALRFLVDALVESLHYYNRLERTEERTVCKLADGLPAEHPSQETLPVPPDHPEFEERLRARLKRHVVERCIYGVDIDLLAVELGQMALWVETMDRTLPFGFLDHKLKVGNSLVGCWLDRFQDYPAMAWEREGGDQNHERFVYHKRLHTITRGKRKGQQEERGDVWTQAIKDKKSEVKSELADVIQGQMSLWREDIRPEDIQLRAVEIFEQLHALPVHETEKRAEVYRTLLENQDYERLKEALNTWCAIWFWPGDKLDLVPMPGNFLAPPEETLEVVSELADQHRFFHWEIEFPDVFTPERKGFDAVVGNPPWDIQKPNSKEFFSNIDPLYRAYGKQEALSKQVEYFRADASIEESWLRYCADLKALSNWVKHVAWPFGDVEGDGANFSFTRSTKQNRYLHEKWRHQRRQRTGLADPEHPFRHQGSADINTYKMFLEIAYTLTRKGGRFGFLVPSGIYTDKGSTALRTLLLEHCRWEWLFGFENREKVFDIDSRFKFCPIVVEKGGRTTAVRATFMHRALQDWEEAEKHVLAYPRERVEQFSPKSRSILEIRDQRDLEVLQKIYANAVLLGDDGPNGWGIRYVTEFHMTNDSKLFPPRPEWEKKGYVPDEYGHWLKGSWQPVEAFGFDVDRSKRDPQYGHWSILDRPDGLVLSRDGRQAIRVEDIEDVALPLYEGRMIGQFDFSEKGWVSGKGRSAVWQEIPFENKVLEPQYLMGKETFFKSEATRFLKLGFLAIGSATNARGMFSATTYDMPHGNAVPVIKTRGMPHGELAFSAILNSYSYDAALRARLGGINLNYYVVEETPLIPTRRVVTLDRFLSVAASLSWPNTLFSIAWLCLSQTFAVTEKAWKKCWALTPYERLRLRCVLDAVVAELYGLDVDDFAWILRDCDYPVECTASNEFTRKFDPKGFWRVDKDKPPELRHTVLSLVAFHDLKRMGLKAFLEQNDGEGWMLPESLCLAHYGLGHDDRAKEPQSVASVLGPRFFDWQLEQDVEESWEECRRHAKLIAKIVPPPEQAFGDNETAEGQEAEQSSDAIDFPGSPVQIDLFGNPIKRKRRR